ncbi:plexin domain-containing protein 2-like isoform X2 [Porites lutea]|uniref:plexin domain-containing protein 2-like isoform X2 n=1 Tax=Porites lutea TaxID=51062 RepID=UPI003CC57024
MMKCLVVFLYFGAFLPCFYLECKAFIYDGFSQHVQYSGRESENILFIDKFHHHRSKRNADSNAPSCKVNNCTYVKVNHKYYVSHTYISGQRFWRNIKENPKSKVHPLSQSFLKKSTLKLSFIFPYYGHYLDSVVLTTGGFLYMDFYNTSLLTDVQYLAPLMAYFSPDHHPDSKVITLDDGLQLTVQWSKVYLRNRTHDGHFTFQCTLHKNGTIWFAYKEIPVNVSSIPDVRYHPVRVGISDAYVRYYRRLGRPGIIYRVFHIYSQVNITKNGVVNGSAVVFHPLTSCVNATSCTECMKRKQTTEFDCQWCPQTKRCSDKTDRNRAEWDLNGCSQNAVNQPSDERCVAGTERYGCVNATSCTECMKRKQTTEFDCQWCPQTKRCSDKTDRNRTEWDLNRCSQDAVNQPSDERCVAGTEQEKQQQKSKGGLGAKEPKGGVGAGAIVGICIVLLLIIGMAAWCVYAYRNPTTKSGLFLIDATRRPRELFQRSGDGASKAAPSDIKPQML